MKTGFEQRLEDEFEIDRGAFPDIDESFWKKVLESRIEIEAFSERLRINCRKMNYLTNKPFGDVDFY